MDDLEDELASVAGLDAPEPAPEAAVVEAQPAPEGAEHHPSPHSGSGTEPHGGTDVS
jgi:segregation and condensation protein B